MTIRSSLLGVALVLTGCLQPTFDVLARPDAGADAGVIRCASNSDCPSGQECLTALRTCNVPVVVNRPSTPNCEAGEWCWVHPLPAGNSIEAVYVVDGREAWAFGENGAILHEQGGVWTSAASPVDTTLLRAWGSGRDNVWAWGSKLVHWNGTAWSAVPLAPQSRIIAVDGSGPSDVWLASASDTATSFQRWTGGAWQPGPALPAGLFIGSFCVRSPNDVWVTAGRSADYPTSLIRWNGSTWSTVYQASMSAERFDSPVVCPADGVALATVWNSDFGTGERLEVGGSVVRRSAQDSGMDLGRTPHGHALLFRGTTTQVWRSTGWETLPSTKAMWFRAFDFTADLSTGVLAEADADPIRWTSSGWDETMRRPRPYLSAFWGGAGDDPRAAFGSGYALSLTTSPPSLVALPTAVDGQVMVVNDAWGSRADDAWLVGQGGSIARWRDGSVTVETSPTSNDVLAIHGSSATNVWAVGKNRTIIRNTGTGWANAPGQLPADIERLPDITFNDVSVLADDDVLVLAHHPAGGAFLVALLKWDGTTWTQELMNGGQSPHLLRTADGTTFLWKDGDPGILRRRLGEPTFTKLQGDVVVPGRFAVTPFGSVEFLGLNRASDTLRRYQVSAALDRFVPVGPVLPSSRFGGLTAGAGGSWWVLGSTAAVMVYRP